jgi:hypothetical protein
VRRGIKHTGQMIAFLGFFAGIVIGFQNCGGYQPVENPLYTQDYSSTCTGPSCASDLNSVQIKIANSTPISIKRPASNVTPVACDLYTCVDVAGYCDPAGYSDSVFYVELRSSNNTGFAKTKTDVKCDGNGRFRILVHLPSNFDRTALYTLVVTMSVIDASGVEEENPTNLHTQEIPLSSSDS